MILASKPTRGGWDIYLHVVKGPDHLRAVQTLSAYGATESRSNVWQLASPVCTPLSPAYRGGRWFESTAAHHPVAIFLCTRKWNSSASPSHCCCFARMHRRSLKWRKPNFRMRTCRTYPTCMTMVTYWQRGRF